MRIDMRFDMMLINILFAMVSGITLVLYLRWNAIQYNKSRVIPFIILFGIVIGCISTKSSTLGDIVNTIKPIFLLVIGILLVKTILGLKWLRSITTFCILTIGMGVNSAIVSLLIGLFFTGDINNMATTNAAFYFFTSLIVAILTVLLLYVIKPIGKFSRQIFNSKDLSFALILTFVILTANASLYYYIKVFNFASFLIITLLSLAYCAYLVLFSASLYKRELKKAEQEQQAFYNQSLENTLAYLRRFKHDWGNNLTTINVMLAMNKVEEAKKYLHEIIDYNTTNNNTLLYNIKNAGLFGIISSKESLAIDKGVKVEIAGTGEISDIPEIKISELCEIVGIFLDNAIEESQKVSGTVEINYADTPETIEIRVRNVCEKDIDLSRFGTESTKGYDRGNGLKIVAQIIGKYKNIKNYPSYESSNKTFEQLLVIKKGL